MNLILLGLSIAIVFRAQQFSLGAEGQIYLAALAVGYVALMPIQLPAILHVLLCLVVAMAVGFLWGLLPGVLKAYLGANELVSTLMLNTIAIRFYELLLTYSLKPDDAGYTASDWFPDSALLPKHIPTKNHTAAMSSHESQVRALWLPMMS